MKEAIGTRVGRLIAGSVHALLDRVETAGPDLVLAQAIRELDATAEEVRAELGQAIATRHLATKRLAEENRRHEELAERIELAVREGRDDLAEAAIARQLDIEAQLPVLEDSIADAVDRQHELEAWAGALAARRRELEDELASGRTPRVPPATFAQPARGPDAARLGELDELARRERIRERLAGFKSRTEG
ncbi:PspA/IM30 family protein [Arenimonas composti]|uniref:PspA/IM30 family protein n=1 Tax=Arenimonas composti TR7-09 = DSM 18010 TaxID=1121013 RepID=A0A091BBM2_9GAMM|nr:PspA/IM30 family protein [Arenimonas composti]KFN50038.1 hypothetical protein P873_08340 [Arenimonas composti TR7-09 = DSM 18010]